MADISTLGKYEIRHEIGRGAMGVVYEGYDPMIKRIVALKTIRADQLAGAEGPNVIARFRREAQAAGRLNHPNIVSIYEFGEDAGTWFIAMEKIEGRELKQCFETNERFTTADIVRIMSQVLDALDYSHRQGVIHRDIKPANIFLLPGGVVKVGDFGIAHIETSNLTQVGAVMGTPSYMSPEQIMGLPVDGRSDLFSAGVILYQFLTGERPFAGSATTTMQKVLKEDPLPPSSLNVQAPAGMDAVVRKALGQASGGSLSDRSRIRRRVARGCARRAGGGRRSHAGRRGGRDSARCADRCRNYGTRRGGADRGGGSAREEIADGCGRRRDRRSRGGDRCGRVVRRAAAVGRTGGDDPGAIGAGGLATDTRRARACAGRGGTRRRRPHRGRC